jgi:hypothetical protein
VRGRGWEPGEAARSRRKNHCLLCAAGQVRPARRGGLIEAQALEDPTRTERWARCSIRLLFPVHRQQDCLAQEVNPEASQEFGIWAAATRTSGGGCTGNGGHRASPPGPAAHSPEPASCYLSGTGPSAGSRGLPGRRPQHGHAVLWPYPVHRVEPLDVCLPEDHAGAATRSFPSPGRAAVWPEAFDHRYPARVASGAAVPGARIRPHAGQLRGGRG